MRNRTLKRVLIAVAIIGAIALCRDDEPTASQELYDEMTALYEATDGEYGWPDFKNQGEKSDE